ncbi:tryptophan 2,3-dioxygenase [Actinoplanes sp. TBRC 11911]|uniref:tryptophan 2,3-dioxygenase n=1 Tax=Actinoplanes sp. TBRC 11911 TaxID=2729386 RepID=UPI00145F377F|nr:tryptophan 2,3-dioxygenase [Actinoplanes sp. TBRC 11911]NMO53144.1 tryptophan 2,3-dioxygenase [Actinoplanes sp. TBRC 11911]
MPGEQRRIEDGIVRDFKVNLSYGKYLHLDEILDAQHPVSRPEHHDELLFIVQHQTTELWFKLVLHELQSVQRLLAKDELRPALKGLARVKHIQRTLTEQWSVLATLTPSEYAEFRSFLGTSSGFQSYQYRAVEFALGNKSREMLSIFDDDPAAEEMLTEALNAPSVYDEFLRYLARHGHDVPVELLRRDVTLPYEFNPGLVPVFQGIYGDPERFWEAYEACEELVDLEENFQFWRFRHMKTVERIIGFKRGTGGSSGVPFLRKALEQTFFPELYAVRTEIGAVR